MLAVCVGKPGIGAGREIKNMPRKIICCFVTSPKKNRRSTASGISQAISPGGFFTHLLTDFKGVRELNLRFRLLLFVRQTKSKEKYLNRMVIFI
jgi:hypothetical protein